MFQQRFRRARGPSNLIESHQISQNQQPNPSPNPPQTSIPIFGEIGNLVGSIQDITKGGPIGALSGAAKQLAKLKIGSSIDYITSLSGGVVKTMMGNFQKDLAGFANSGLKILYDNVFGKVFAAVGKMAPAKLVGTNAQAAFIGPLKSIFGDFGCVINNVSSVF